MSERPDGELFVSEHGGDLSALFDAIVEQPASTAAALKHMQAFKPDSQLFRAAQELAVAAARLEAAGPEDGEPLAERCAQVAAQLNMDGKTDEAAVVLSLAVRLGAEGEAVDALARTIATGVIAHMRQAMNGGDDSGAAHAADILKGLSPDLSEAWATSGRLALKRGQARSARADLERAVELSPESQNTLLNLARAQTADGAFNDSVTTLFRLLRVADGSDGRYRPFAVTELENVFHVAAQAATKAPTDNDLLQTCFSAMENIADGVSGNVIEYVAGARNCARTAIGFARVALAVGQGRRGLAACDAAIEIEPDVAALWSIIGRLRLHYNENAQAAQAFRQSLELEPDQPSVRDGLAEALFRAGDYDGAMQAADAAVTAAPGNSTLESRRCRIDQIRSASTAPSTWPEGQRHIAMLGMAHQGGAWIGRLLAERTGGMFVGESYWMAGQGADADGNTRFSSCQTCRRPECDVFDLDFRTALTADPADWYRRIADTASARVLVSSDNSAQIVRSLDPALVCDSLIVFRSPAMAWAMLKESYARQKRTLPSLTQFLQTWYRTYSAALHEFPQTGEHLAVDMDHLAEGVDDALTTVCAGFELAEIDGSGDPAEHHFFGVSAEELTSGALQGADPARQLSAAERVMIEGYADALEIYEQLQELAVNPTA